MYLNYFCFDHSGVHKKYRNELLILILVCCIAMLCYSIFYIRCAISVDNLIFKIHNISGDYHSTSVSLLDGTCCALQKSHIFCCRNTIRPSLIFTDDLITWLDTKANILNQYLLWKDSPTRGKCFHFTSYINILNDKHCLNSTNIW